jgi:hypothetical protein
LEINPVEQLKNCEQHWKGTFLSPIWYLSVVPKLHQLIKNVRRESKVVQDEFKTSLYDFFESQLSRGNIPLGRGSGDFDVNRKEIDTVVIHHTSNSSGLSLSRLSAIELVRLYAPYFANPTAEEDRHLKGQPIYSGHVRNGRQVFWPYHWIVRNDGRPERLLRDNEIGWHAGDWNVNCRSIAIALDNDYEYGRPDEEQLWAIARIVVDHYRNVSHRRVLGHREVNSKTICPSKFFLDGNGKGWKSDLLLLLRES